MSGNRKNSWGDPIRFSQTLAAGQGGDGGGCPIPTEEEVKAILARKAAREAEEAKATAGVNEEVQIGREEEEAKPNTKTTQGVKPKAATAEVKSDWAEKIRELLAGGVKADGGARLNTTKHTNNSSGRTLGEAVVKPVPWAGNPTPAVAKYGSRCGTGQLAPPNRSTIASANQNSGFEKKQFAPPVTTASAPAKFNPALEKKLFTSQPIATAKTPQKTHFTYPHVTTGPAVHNPTIDKKRFTSPPVTTIHAPAIPVFDPQLEKKQFASPPATSHHQKQPLQPRKDQGKTNPYPKPSKMPHQNSPVTPVLPTAVIAARVAAKAKLAAEREEKLAQMVKYKQVISTGGTGMV
ncbi:hypothetical protein B9Z19DRAFT_1157991 [Tuber borchii]|uniref:Uncharacterized protein n=1 Tax=Tuber borchii TaxID=42251 RepID=A0A2T6ZGF6_TUBBO|nr:hypothetical protein B9Z19DRAFT_1157991 [Tuber borchii]